MSITADRHAEKSEREIGSSNVPVASHGKEAKKGTEVLGKDERKVARSRELMAANVKAVDGEDEVKVGKDKVAVPVLQAAQAAEIAAHEEEVRERKIDDARKRILEKEVAAAA